MPPQYLKCMLYLRFNVTYPDITFKSFNLSPNVKTISSKSASVRRSFKVLIQLDYWLIRWWTFPLMPSELSLSCSWCVTDDDIAASQPGSLEIRTQRGRDTKFVMSRGFKIKHWCFRTMKYLWYLQILLPLYWIIPALPQIQPLLDVNRWATSTRSHLHDNEKIPRALWSWDSSERRSVMSAVPFIGPFRGTASKCTCKRQWLW